MKYLPPYCGISNSVYCADALDLLDWLYRQNVKVDAIITDIPYGTTACSWDTIIPFEPMWAGIKRILKPRGVFVTTASQPFTSALVMSNLAWFKYEWVWNKVRPSGFQYADYRPMMQHENIVIFSGGSLNYFPQKINRDKPVTYRGYGKSESNNIGKRDKQIRISYDISPKTILDFVEPRSVAQHPTQKPLALYEYLIKTYTQPGELVLDFACGSGTTGLAARNLKRKFILGDTSAEYCEIARERLKTEFASRKQREGEALDELPLFRGDKLYQPAGEI